MSTLLQSIKLEMTRGGKGATGAVLSVFDNQAMDLIGEKNLKGALEDLSLTYIRILLNHNRISKEVFAWFERRRAKKMK